MIASCGRVRGRVTWAEEGQRCEPITPGGGGAGRVESRKVVYGGGSRGWRARVPVPASGVPVRSDADGGEGPAPGRGDGGHEEEEEKSEENEESGEAAPAARGSGGSRAGGGGGGAGGGEAGGGGGGSPRPALEDALPHVGSRAGAGRAGVR